MKKSSKDKTSANKEAAASRRTESTAAIEEELAPDTTADAEEAAEASETGDDDPVKRLEQEKAALENSLLRAKADYQNLQRRSAADRLDAVRFANAELMRSLLAVADDFERALHAGQAHQGSEAVTDGVRIVYDHFLKALKDQGLEPIESLHQPFDPTIHEALMQRPTEAHPPGTVVEEVAKGYRLHDRVIRPAKVVVASEKKGDTGGEDGAD